MPCTHWHLPGARCSDKSVEWKLWSPPPPQSSHAPPESMTQLLTIFPVKDNESVMTFNPRNSYYGGGSKLAFHVKFGLCCSSFEVRI